MRLEESPQAPDVGEADAVSDLAAIELGCGQQIFGGLQATRMLNDIAWLQFIGGLALIMPMFVVAAVVGLNDKSRNPLFPRWFAYQSIMTFLLFLPDQLLFFFKTGPFAWNGVLGFWVPLTVFCGWFISIFILMRRALVAEKHDTGERTPTPVG